MSQQTLLPVAVKDPARVLSPSQNRKLAKSGIVECSELEDASNGGCKWFSGPDLSQSPLCPGCWSAALFKVRRRNAKGNKRTPNRGLIRLGTWREITLEDWHSFRAGVGTQRSGKTWARPDFKDRFAFIVTRGLEPMQLYSEVAKDARMLNIQVSVDIMIDENGRTRQIPHDGRLRELVAIPKAIFRFKTLSEDRTHKGKTFRRNVERFADLRERLGIAPVRILETPLRLGTHSYGEDTPLQRLGLPVLPSESFMRCNTPCMDCKGENGVLACAATERILQRLEKVGTAKPVRKPKAPDVHIDWTDLVKAAMANLGGTATIQGLYAEVQRLQPAVERNPIWDVKVRQAVRRFAHRTAKATWSTQPILSVAIPAPVAAP